MSIQAQLRGYDESKGRSADPPGLEARGSREAVLRVTHFMRRPGQNAYSVERIFEDLRSNLPGDIETRVHVSPFLSRGILPRLYNIVSAPRHQADVNHITGDVHFLALLLKGRKTILTVLDCVSLQRLQGPRRLIVWFFWYWLPIRRCAVITVISEATRRQVLETVRCDPAKVHVIPPAISAEFQPVHRPFNQNHPRILHVGTKSNKNLERHAAALEGIECTLIVVGPLSDEQRAVLDDHRIQFQAVSGIGREEMVRQYVECDLLLFASTYEGFGLPIVEAQAVGRPVVTSDLWSMPEVAGAAACLVDPYSVESVRSGVLRVITDAGYRDGLVSSGFGNVERFRLVKVAERYSALYRQVREASE